MSLNQQRSLIFRIERFVYWFKEISLTVQSSALDIRSQHLISIYEEFLENQQRLELNHGIDIGKQIDIRRQVEEWYNFCITRMSIVQRQIEYRVQVEEDIHTHASRCENQGIAEKPMFSENEQLAMDRFWKNYERKSEMESKLKIETSTSNEQVLESSREIQALENSDARSDVVEVGAMQSSINGAQSQPMFGTNGTDGSMKQVVLSTAGISESCKIRLNENLRMQGDCRSNFNAASENFIDRYIGKQQEFKRTNQSTIEQVMYHHGIINVNRIGLQRQSKADKIFDFNRKYRDFKKFLVKSRSKIKYKQQHGGARSHLLIGTSCTGETTEKIILDTQAVERVIDHHIEILDHESIISMQPGLMNRSVPDKKCINLKCLHVNSKLKAEQVKSNLVSAIKPKALNSIKYIPSMQLNPILIFFELFLIIAFVISQSRIFKSTKQDFGWHTFSHHQRQSYHCKIGSLQFGSNRFADTYCCFELILVFKWLNKQKKPSFFIQLVESPSKFTSKNGHHHKLRVRPPYTEQRNSTLQDWSRYFKNWNIWHNEYLSSLQQRTKWLNPQDNIKEGQLVLLREEDTPPAKRPVARILKVYPGNDDNVRVVKLEKYKTTIKPPIPSDFKMYLAKLKTHKSVFKRPITMISVLPIEDNYDMN